MTGTGAQSDAGFTLVEMMVALFIFALIASAGTAVLSFSLRSTEAAAGVQDRLGEVQLSRARLKADLGQVLDRPVRDPYGGQAAWSFRGIGSDGGQDLPLLSFVHGGWDNPGLSEPRGALQYVEYLLKDRQLIRRARLRLDPVPDQELREEVVLSGIDALRFRFYRQGQWLNEWRMNAGPSGAPEMVEMVVDLEGFGEMRQLFLTAEGG